MFLYRNVQNGVNFICFVRNIFTKFPDNSIFLDETFKASIESKIIKFFY